MSTSTLLPRVAAVPLTPEIVQRCTQDGPPDSCVLVVRVTEPYAPVPPTSLPSQRSFKMSRENAEAMCILLNREALSETNCEHWYVVGYHYNSGFHAVRVLVPFNWKPEDEYSLPANAVGPLSNCTARRKMREFNRDQLDTAVETGESVQHWAIHVKPLRKPKEQSEIKLDDRQRKILAILKNCTNGMTDVEERASGILYRLTGTYGMIHSDQSDADIIGSLRTIAGSLLDAANHIEGSPTPQLY